MQKLQKIITATSSASTKTEEAAAAVKDNTNETSKLWSSVSTRKWVRIAKQFYFLFMPVY